jgi:Omp85 superfamily domain
MYMPRTLAFLCVAVLLLAGPVRAQEVNVEEESDAPASEPDRQTIDLAPHTQVDIGDLWHMLLHREPSENDARRRFLVVAPTIGSKPSTGLTLGLNGNVAFFLGDPANTHISSVSGGARVSEKHQTLTGFRFSTFSNQDRYFFQGDNRFSWTSQNIYGLGGDSPAASGENVKYDYVRVFGTAYKNVMPRLFVGVGLNVSDHSDIRPSSSTANWEQSAYMEYTEKHGFAPDGQTSAGPSVSLLYDTRDNAINARRGAMANVTYRTYYDGFLGGDATWQELYLDARTYKALTKDGRHRLAFWFLGDMVTGGTAPYFDLPATASNERSARGYGEGRYRGEHLLYGEMEYRGSITPSGLVGVVAFLNTTTVDNADAGEKLFESFAPGAGFGFRFLLNKKSRTNLCTDYGWGKAGSRGFYLSIQEAF